MSLRVPTMAEMASSGQAPEILFWVGCAGSFDERYKAVTQAVVLLPEALQPTWSGAPRPASAQCP